MHLSRKWKDEALTATLCIGVTSLCADITLGKLLLGNIGQHLQKSVFSMVLRFVGFLIFYKVSVQFGACLKLVWVLDLGPGDPPGKATQEAFPNLKDPSELVRSRTK